MTTTIMDWYGCPATGCGLWVPSDNRLLRGRMNADSAHTHSGAWLNACGVGGMVCNGTGGGRFLRDGPQRPIVVRFAPSVQQNEFRVLPWDFGTEVPVTAWILWLWILKPDFASPEVGDTLDRH